MALTFIAEIGLNHNGNFGLLPELIRQASLAGADIAKFQLGWRAGEGEMNQLTKKELKVIVDACEYYGVEPMFSIFTEEALETIKTFDYDFTHYKIASRTVVDNPELVEKVLDEGKETFVSLGFWDREGLPFENRDNLNYLFCISKYPCLPNDIKNFPEDFSSSPYIGYSDHTIGTEAVLLAVARGAKVIEKHFTLDKSDTTIRDHALSTTPDEFGEMVKNARAISRLLDLGV
ncbi:N-acetylneuraminate synthase family protein [Vibrio sp. S4M6]|uniref:N-acetylneuraminate synthase family protein n=1 Tax=Vibrio sinus TaxID=2946865 RepID=UPI00202A4396|nr:N-acetylneuraminate synthase family protein [Vibrio sinus]MCL9781553.1 N-acetylneuraminate synthase family protein [Vibrio sinus]